MAGHVYDLWTRPSGQVDKRGRPIPERTERWGKGKRWRVTVYDDGRRRYRTFETRDAATAYLQDTNRDQRVGEWVRPTDVLFTDYGAEWVAGQLHQRPTTIEQIKVRWRVTIAPAFEGLRLVEIERRHVQAAVNAWASPTAERKALAPTTISVAYGYLAAIFQAAVDDRLIKATPCRRISRPPVERSRVVPLTPAQVQRIAADCPPRWRMLVLLGAATGMRSGELRGLTRDRIRWVEGPAPVLPEALIRVDRLATTGARLGPPKTERSNRTIRLDAVTAAELRVYLARYEVPADGFVFVGRGGQPISRPASIGIWRTATRNVVTRDRSGWHDLRHFHASMLIAAGLSPVAVAERLGHRDASETLATYSHLWMNDESRSVDAIRSALWG